MQDSGAGEASSNTEGSRCHRDADAGVQFSTADKSVVWDEGRRMLVSKDAESKLMKNESRNTEVGRFLVAV